MLEQFKEHIESKFPELLETKFLLACSGGLDSVVLTHLCFESEMDFAVAHCNFRLRGEESNRDEKFVSELAKKMGRTFFVTHFDTVGYVNQHKVSVQMAARTLRYSWFDTILEENNISKLVTAHHGDDDLETFLINLSRGTGIDGLTGIPRKTDKVYRPLLFFSRKQLSDYARSKNLKWREDKSNTDTKYLRNKIRQEIIPTLKELHPTFLENFQNTQFFLNQTAQLAHQQIQKTKETLFVKEGNLIKISVKELKKLKPLTAYLYGLFNEFGFTEWNNVLDMLEGMSGKQILSNTHVLLKNREFLILSERKKADLNTKGILIEKGQKTIETPLQMKFSGVESRGNNTQTIIYVAKNALKYPLMIRKWKKGDYFYPLGLEGKKKLSKFFKDEKVDVISKQEQWLLCSEDEVVWVIGRRADERFKVQNDTREVLKIEVIQ